ncbi:DUF1684 domain-containing protein [Rubrivirga sp.]|uniref:DUF1684 domain-containing protein n=1 Tax=Rubrivirga sp. TaxID=1885344 RepID=UPI003C70F462
MRRLVLLILIAGCASEPPPALDRAALEDVWNQWAADRDSVFATTAGPLLEPARETFAGLDYFDYDSTFAVPAALVPSLGQDTLAFPTTSGDLRPMVTAGHLVFEAGDVQWRLEAFRPLGSGELFVPFRDATSGRETYGGGRYLDLEEQPSGRYALDFNRSYNPYCVYDPAFSCPLPPAENRLELPITAGEVMPSGKPGVDSPSRATEG